MVEGTGSIGQNVLKTPTQRTQQNFKQPDTNESGGLDINEIQDRAEKTKIIDNFDQILDPHGFLLFGANQVF